MRLNQRSCFLILTLLLGLACLCCAGQGLLLALNRAAPPARAGQLAHRLRVRLEDAQSVYSQIARATCDTLEAEAPPIFILRPEEARAFPQIDEAAGRLNRAIDHIGWAILTCAGQPDPFHLEAARRALAEAAALIDALAAACPFHSGAWA